MTNLTDTQTTILSLAAQHDEGASLDDIGAKVNVAKPKRAADALVKRGLLESVDLPHVSGVRSLPGYRITAEGKEAIGIEDEAPKQGKTPADEGREAARDDDKAREAAGTSKRAAPKEGTRARGIFDMLTRPEGATAAECREAGLGSVSLGAHASRFATRYGLKVRSEKDNRGERVRLTA